VVVELEEVQVQHPSQQETVEVHQLLYLIHQQVAVEEDHKIQVLLQVVELVQQVDQAVVVVIQVLVVEQVTLLQLVHLKEMQVQQ
tara:strand:+ start:117 stop:371 length:255 start_codon:yes stop_codon:yes gene_type:complete